MAGAAGQQGGASKSAMIKVVVAVVLFAVAGVLVYVQFFSSDVGPNGTTGVDASKAPPADPKAPGVPAVLTDGSARGGHRRAPGS